ncbi:MAG TPA: LysR family transcriptional regulator [Nevskiaceae bacterium]
MPNRDSIELRHLRDFVAVAEELHFGRAAERLGISQPPLSQQIRQLEQRLGVRLFTRTNRRVALTAAGAALLPEARELLARTDHALELAQRAARGEVGELRLGLTRSTALSGYIPRAIMRFRQRFPLVHLTLHELNSLQQVDALLERKLQLGFVRNGRLPAPLASRYLFDDPLVAVVPGDGVDAAGTRAAPALHAADLAQRPFVLFAPRAGAGIRGQIMTLCRDAGFTPRVTQEALEASTIVGLVAAGIGVSILPASYAHVHIPGVRYLPLTDKGAVSRIDLAWRRDEREPAVARFVDLIGETAGPVPVARSGGVRGAD